MAASKKTVLITGSTRGIGLAFAEYYTKAGWNVIGTARAGSNTDKLAALSPFKIVTLDAGDEATVLDTARQLDGVPIHLLINNAGIGVYSTFETATKADIMKVFEVNAVGPFLATRALLPNLKLATDTQTPAIVLQITSIMGSIACNNDEHAQLFRGQYGYTTSKAALNMITRSLAMDLREHGVAVVTVNPGYVDTDMTHHQGVVKPADTVSAMADIVAKLKLEDTSKFFNADPTIPVPSESQNTEIADGDSVDGKSFAEKFAVRWWQHNLRSYKKMAGLLEKVNIDTRAGKDLIEDLEAWTSKHFGEGNIIPSSELPW
ncbi:C-factor [Phytophthora nicotianae]|uniref:C-factor n=2 Tax=Phytophthora nicotianae TaxID=4792 RepID=A0A0W8D2Z6_PHYNI|nr:C-factor [Phytophthora nicotianae]KUF90769.1 DNA replication complex GINS protein PSF2 [Phytophthora nicotianae]